MTRQRTLASIVRASAPLLTRYMAGFDETTRVAQAPGLPNHLAWILGHCALTMHRCAEKFDGAPLPSSDFVTGDGGAGDADRFDTESVCFQSTPLPDESLYPTLDRARAIFEAGAERLASTLERATDEQIDASYSWYSSTDDVNELVARMVAHNGTHAGQLTDLRRALGMPGIFG